jgi:hypothetical protein
MKNPDADPVDLTSYPIHPLIFYVIDTRLPAIAAWQFIVLGFGSYICIDLI